jgi:putative ABC transport system permease protein
MGDTHAGFRVVGTDDNYFEHYRYARDRRLGLQQGAWFGAEDEIVLGAEVAASLGYRLGDKVIVAHGAGDESFIKHADEPFRVIGILAATGTPVDRTLHVSLAGFDHMHEAWQIAEDGHDHDPLAATASAEGHTDEEQHAEDEHHDEEYSISAFLLGLESRTAAIGLQRRINQFEHEPLSAILPGVTLLELWEIVGLVEHTLRAISIFVVIVGLSSLLIILMTSINERRREMAILRALGARPLVCGIFMLGQGWIASRFGLFIELNLLTPNLVYGLLLITLISCLIGLIPGIRMYRYSLVDGMTIRV